MSTIRLLALAALLSVGPVAGAQPFGVFDLNDLSGPELYARFCASCHGDEARGDGPVASSLTVPVPDLTRIAERNGGTFPVERVQQFIDGRIDIMAHGPRTMPVWGYELWWEGGADRIAEADTRVLLERLVEFLRTLQRVP
jgi:mono/diheme cytochrome c family protein